MTLFDTRLLNIDFLEIAKVHGMGDHDKAVRKRSAKQGWKTKKLKQLKK